MKQWMNECVGGWMHEYMDGLMSELLLCWATSSLSDLFAEAPLVSAASSLGRPLSGLLLLPPSSERPPSSSSVASAPQLSVPTPVATHGPKTNCLLHSCYNVPKSPSNFHLESRIAGGSQHHWRFAVRSRAHAFCHNGCKMLQTCMAGASRHIDQYFPQRQPCELFRTMLRLSFLSRTFVKPSSRYSPVHFLSKTLPDRGLHL